jgi:hypothetical protein
MMELSGGIGELSAESLGILADNLPQQRTCGVIQHVGTVTREFVRSSPFGDPKRSKLHGSPQGLLKSVRSRRESRSFDHGRLVCVRLTYQAEREAGRLIHHFRFKIQCPFNQHKLPADALKRMLGGNLDQSVFFAQAR